MGTTLASNMLQGSSGRRSKLVESKEQRDNKNGALITNTRASSRQD